MAYVANTETPNVRGIATFCAEQAQDAANPPSRVPFCCSRANRLALKTIRDMQLLSELGAPCRREGLESRRMRKAGRGLCVF